MTHSIWVIFYDSICLTCIHWSVTGSLILDIHGFISGQLPRITFNFRPTSAVKSVSWSIWNRFVFLEYSILFSKWFWGAISSAKNKNLHFRQFFVQLVWNKFRNFRGHQSEKLNQRVLNLLVFHFFKFYLFLRINFEVHLYISTWRLQKTEDFRTEESEDWNKAKAGWKYKCADNIMMN